MLRRVFVGAKLVEREVEMVNEVTGIKFIDNFIERKSFLWTIKLIGWVYIISGVLGIVGIFCFKGAILYKWSNYNIPKWIIRYGVYEYLIKGPIEIITGLLLLRIKEWGRKLVLLILGYNIITLVFDAFVKLNAVLVKQSNQQVWLVIFITCNLVVLFFELFAIYIFTRSKVKEQFKKQALST